MSLYFLSTLAFTLSNSATYVRDTTFNLTVSTFAIGDGMWCSPKDNTIFFTGRDTEGGPYHFYQYSTTGDNNQLNYWKSGDWSEPEMLMTLYRNNLTKFWFADQGYAVLSEFDVASGAVDGQIGIENQMGTGTDPIQFMTPGEVEFIPDNGTETDDRILFFGDCQPFMPSHRFGKLKVLFSQSNGQKQIPTETIFVVGTNGTVTTDIMFEDITTLAYDVTRDWVWLNDYVQYQVFIYDGTTGKYVTKWPCNAGIANGGVYFDRNRDIFWQVISGSIEAFDMSSVKTASDVSNFDCKTGSIFDQDYRHIGEPTALAVSENEGDVYVAATNYNINTGAFIYRYLYQA